jgi:GNAT superfamily N-acetyltransferase
MSESELEREIASGVVFYGYFDGNAVTGVMGIQDVREVTLIRHAYIRTAYQRRGIGATLLNHLKSLSSKPILIGTWAAAKWAIDFYEKNGFELVSDEEKNRLLAEYWDIPPRQIETSVVLRESRR